MEDKEGMRRVLIGPVNEHGKDTGGCSVVVSTLARQARDLGSIPSTCLMFFNLFIYKAYTLYPNPNLSPTRTTFPKILVCESNLNNQWQKLMVLHLGIIGQNTQVRR